MLFHNISMPLIAEESGAATSQTILDGSDTVCRTQDYNFYVNVPEGATVTWGYEFVHKGYSPIDLIFENGKYYGLLNSQNYPEEETSFKVYVTVQTATDSYRVEKIVTFIDHEGGTATCSQKAICIHCGQEYGETDPSNHTLTHVASKSAIFEEEGNVEYWHCQECDKNFANAQASTELDSVTTDKLEPIQEEDFKFFGEDSVCKTQDYEFKLEALQNKNYLVAFIFGENRLIYQFKPTEEKEFLNLEEAIRHWNFSRRKFYRFLDETKGGKFLAYYKERKLILRVAFEKYLQENPIVKEGLVNGKVRARANKTRCEE